MEEGTSTPAEIRPCGTVTVGGSEEKRNVFTLEKVGFDLAPKEARKGHRVLWILVCRGSATRSPGHVGGVVAESDRREGGKGMGWGRQKDP